MEVPLLDADQVPGTERPGTFAIAMGAMDTRILIDGLQRTLRAQLDEVQGLRSLPLEVLRTRPEPKRWSVLEVIEHMNLSSGHYYAALQRIYGEANNGLRSASSYTPGRWGSYFTEAMKPKDDGVIGWKMRTLGRFEPKAGGSVALDALDRFEAMCLGFIGLLERARTRGLEGEKVTSTLGPLLRFKVGDAFRFPIAHQERHFLQIRRTLAVVKSA